jgi:hypothetical protein
MAIIIAVNANGKPTNKSASLFLVAPALYLLGIIDAESLFINLIKMYPLDMITPDNITRILESNAKLLN